MLSPIFDFDNEHIYNGCLVFGRIMTLIFVAGGVYMFSKFWYQEKYKLIRKNLMSLFAIVGFLLSYFGGVNRYMTPFDNFLLVVIFTGFFALIGYNFPVFLLGSFFLNIVMEVEKKLKF